jgi:hypothetical protein
LPPPLLALAMAFWALASGFFGSAFLGAILAAARATRGSRVSGAGRTGREGTRRATGRDQPSPSPAALAAALALHCQLRLHRRDTGHTHLGLRSALREA